jgi:hypothetical protein
VKLELTNSKKRLLLITFVISGWILAIFLFIYLFASNKENETPSFKEGLRVFAADLGGEIYKKIGNKTILFLNFTDFQGNETNIGNYTAQSLLPFLLKNKNIKIVDRRHVRLSLDELNFQRTALAEQTQTLKLGKIVSSDHVLIGKAEYADNTISISIQILDINTNIINVSESITVLSDKIAYKISGGEEKEQRVLFLFFEKSMQFFKENYQWLWTAIVIPIAGLFIRSKNKVTSENNEEATE